MKKVSLSMVTRSIGLVDASPDLKAYARPDWSFSPQELFGWSRANGVVPQVLANLRHLAVRGVSTNFVKGFEELCTPYLDARIGRMSELLKTFEAVAYHSQQAGIDLLIIKGAAFRRCYPEHCPRIHSDIDIVVKEADVWRTLSMFEKMDLPIRRVRLERYRSSSAQRERSLGGFGVCEIGGNSVEFDLHLGAFPACGDSVLETDLWARAENWPIGKWSVKAPSPEDSVLIILAHISRHGYARVRDLNDIYISVKRTVDNFDWKYLEEQARINGLSGVYSAIMTVFADRYSTFMQAVYPQRRNTPKATMAKLLFDTGRYSNRHHGNRALRISRIFQMKFLFAHELIRGGYLHATTNTIISAYYLFRTGRPYPLWKGDNFESLAATKRIVVVPLRSATSLNPLDRQRVAQVSELFRLELETLSPHVIAINPNRPNELIATEAGIFVRSAYDGTVSNSRLVSAESEGARLVELLSEFGYRTEGCARSIGDSYIAS